jgi:hypothetical protein
MNVRTTNDALSERRNNSGKALSFPFARDLNNPIAAFDVRETSAHNFPNQPSYRPIATRDVDSGVVLPSLEVQSCNFMRSVFLVG